MKGTRAQYVPPEFLQWSPPSGESVRVFFAPGRINLLGEHTDYNGGYVLPGAIDRGTWLWIRRRPDQVWRFGSKTESKIITVTSESLHYHAENGFANYPAGVVWALRQEGMDVPGADCYFVGNVPQGAGLSSSASLEVVMAWALMALADIDRDRAMVATLAHRAETEFVGVPCGVMDQYTVALGRKDHVLSLCAGTLVYNWIPVDLSSVSLVIVNSNKPHHLISSPYKKRRSECDAALASLQHSGVPIGNLADMDVAQWAEHRTLVTDPILQKRVNHVVSENWRARQGAQWLLHGDLTRFGEAMRSSHESLRDDYEVTGSELDALAETAWTVPGCLGSRMTGAGFGGSTIALVYSTALNDFQARIEEPYRRRFGYSPTFLTAQLGDGVHEVHERGPTP